MDFKELQELIRILEDSELIELEIEEDGRRIRLHKAVPVAPPVAMAPTPPVSDAPVPGNPSVDESAETDDTLGLATIDAPMVGTFYSAASPGEDPFVRPGDRIEENQIVCIVEAMKLMNEIGAKTTGIIEKVLVENGQPVEFGQPLFALRELE